DAAERLALEKRAEFSKETKRKAWDRSKGICECGCGVKIVDGDGPEYDHELECFLGGDNSLENCRVLRLRCHKQKTRLRRLELDKTRRGLEKRLNLRTKKSRPMAGNRNSRFKKKMDGSVERRW
ncbi:MAG: hypothetical protein K0U61_02620, partial [Alphaproteobacteria bacterium]|nr:hypothetical protein [Alphaproteobacteria bacterium]